jgi:hypothetical protein
MGGKSGSFVRPVAASLAAPHMAEGRPSVLGLGLTASEPRLDYLTNRETGGRIHTRRESPNGGGSPADPKVEVTGWGLDRLRL